MTLKSPTSLRSLLGITLLLLVAFSLAAKLGPPMEQRLVENGAGDDDAIARWLGDCRRIFANSFFVKADKYFHSGYYPTIYDNTAPFKTAHMAEDSGAAKSQNTGDEETIFSHPHNWVEKFELNFFPSHHTHLDEGGVDGNGAEEVKEIMPWLKISSELDPQRIETYLITAYWLRVRMHKVGEAEDFLREGLRANPGSAAILFELGQLYRQAHNNYQQARNLYLAALNRWGVENNGKEEPDKFLLDHIAGALVQVEKHEGDKVAQLNYMRLWKRASPTPEAIQKQIDELDPTGSLSADVIGNATGNLNSTNTSKP